MRAAEDGGEAFTAGMVTSAAHIIRQLCTDKPEQGKVNFLLSTTLALVNLTCSLGHVIDCRS